MKIYISGPMTGYDDFNRKEFNKAALQIDIKGDTPINPAILPDSLTQAEYMDICLAMLRAADAIYMLNGFEESKGAMCELAYAEKLGLKVMEQE